MNDLGWNINDKTYMQIDVNNIILNIENKFHKLAKWGFKIHQQFEHIYTVYIDRIVRAIA